MGKKKIDQRIRTLVENNVHLRHRSFFVIIGDRGKDQVVNLHYILSKAQVAKRPAVLWCYKKDLGFSSHRKKRIKELKKKKQLGLSGGEREEDAFELFLSSTDIRYTYYHETESVLGNTFGMCVLQDFEALTPNLLARTIETVQGGGVVILLLKTMTSLKQLYTMVMDVHSRYRTATQHEAVARFNERFLLSLTSCGSCLVIDDQLNIIPISSSQKNIAPIENALPEGGKSDQDLELENLKATLATDEKNKTAASLVNVARTIDQAKVLQSFLQVLKDQKTCMRTTVSLTAGRGRGKSAALGLALAGAVASGYGNVFVTAPSPENLKTLFEFLLRGFDALGYTEHLDYDVVQSVHAEFNKAVVRVNVFKGDHRQTILYVQPQDSYLLNQAELMLIDEAAAIPLPLVQALFHGPHLVFMASTVNGYEGTGRSLSLKLIQQLRSQSSSVDHTVKNSRLLREFELSIPIRYAAGDPVEKWLNGLLCLDASAAPLKQQNSVFPHPDQCELYSVNRDTLFSYHRASEMFLQKMLALCTASHYKNTPNDLQLMSDAPAHRLFVLLPPVDEQNTSTLPDILCVIQVCLEGQISKQVIMSSLARGKRAAGDLIPWTVSQQFQDDQFASLSGARIVRIAVHPDLQGMGYGTRAMKLLEMYFKGELIDETIEELEDDEEMTLAPNVPDDIIKPRSNLKPLLLKVSDKKPVELHWLGVSFGLTPALFKFWNRLGFKPVYLRQTTNELTGEHTSIVLRSLSQTAQNTTCASDWLDVFYGDFRKRFISLLSFQFRSFPPALCLDLLNCQSKLAKDRTFDHGQIISAYDLKRLESYANNMVDYHMIMDLVPDLAREYFSSPPTQIHLSPVQSAILLSLGLQHRVIEDLEKELNLPTSQMLAMFIKAVRKFAAFHKNLKLQEVGDKPPMEIDENSNDGSNKSNSKRSIGHEPWLPMEQTLQDDLEDGARKADAALREKQRELINSLDLKQYQIVGNDEEWEKEVSKKRRNIEKTIINVSRPASTEKKDQAKEAYQESLKKPKRSKK